MKYVYLMATITVILRKVTAEVQTTVPPVHCHTGSSDVDTSGWLQTYALRLSVDVTCI